MYRCHIYELIPKGIPIIVLLCGSGVNKLRSPSFYETFKTVLGTYEVFSKFVIFWFTFFLM